MEYKFSLFCLRSGSGPAASDPEDRLSGPDNTEGRRDTGSIHRAEPRRHHYPHHTSPDHITAGMVWGARAERLIEFKPTIAML